MLVYVYRTLENSKRILLPEIRAKKRESSLSPRRGISLVLQNMPYHHEIVRLLADSRKLFFSKIIDVVLGNLCDGCLGIVRNLYPYHKQDRQSSLGSTTIRYLLLSR